MYDQYKDRAEFYVVYIQEAHASDVWQMPSNVSQNVVFRSPRSYTERGAIADACIRNLHLKMPAVLDTFHNPTEAAYTGWPDRLYVIDRNGRVAYKSKPGPFGFHPAQMEEVLKRVIL